jgi:glycosyltransferase involved in cell wall biosynthesis
MRLTLVTETFPPEVNGVAKTLGRWVETFQARGHAVDVVRPSRPRERIAEDGAMGLSVPFYPQVRLGLALPWQLEQRYRRFQTELVHIATEGPLGLAALWAGGRRRLPIASSFHTNFDHYMTHYGLAGWEWCGRAYLRWFHNRCAVTLAPSRATQRRLLKRGFERVEVWSRGVDADLFNPRRRDRALRAALGLGETDVLLLYVGRLAAEKNLDALLAVHSQLQGMLGAAAPSVRLALVGDGPMHDSIMQRRLSGVHLAGARHGPELARWFASADIFTFPSQTETFGNAILEAQASGLAVVAFDYETTRERIVNGKDGILLHRVEEWPAALRCLVCDQLERKRLAAAARHTAERQGWGPIFDELERCYEGLIAARK